MNQLYVIVQHKRWRYQEFYQHCPPALKYIPPTSWISILVYEGFDHKGCLKKQNSWRKCRQGTLQLSVHMDLPLATQNHFFQSNPRWITCVHQELIQSMYDNAGLLASSDQRLRDDYWQLPVQLKSFHFWASQLAQAIKCCKLQPGTPMQSKSVRLTWKQQQTLSSKWLLVALSLRMMNNFCSNQASSAPAIISSRGQ